MADLTAYTGLFLAALLAATLFPAQSEVGLATLIMSGDYSISLLIIIATLGNVLGSVVNWLMGRGVERFANRKWFPISPAQMAKAKRRYHRYGRWSLLMSWAPLIGDPLTLVAGVLREPLGSFLVLVTLAKGVRYAVVALIALGVMEWT
ncbi:MAG: membrane protein YqaA with SNARE-associated domain [Parvibaculaceae bacterium]|jgi:membrane protein YqaA with SNARE-associated domain|nr:DedA family protein [Parvibaculaceae bacterium]